MSKNEGTESLLVKACSMLNNYAKATGAMVCVHDYNCKVVPEIFGEAFSERNMCLHCVRRTGNPVPEHVTEAPPNPCDNLHFTAIRESYRYGGSYTYRCPLGFMFWTSPIYVQSRFVGALLGSGFRDDGSKISYADGEPVTDPEFLAKLEQFPYAKPEKVRALAELMLICAESLSSGNEHYYETIKRRAQQQSRLMASIRELELKYPQGNDFPGYPMDKERQLLTALRRGDPESGKAILNDILAALLFSNPGEYKYIQFRAIEIVVLLSRAGTGGIAAGLDQDQLETNNGNIKRIEDAKSIEELTDVLNVMVEQMAEQIFSFQGVRHAAALRKVERYLQENYHRKVSLKEVADMSGLSAPYFSTIFKEEMGENFSSYLNQLRVEAASRLLRETSQSLSEIAGACGFEDQSWFSKIFKSYTGLSPGKYRGQNGSVKEISDRNFSVNFRNNVKM
ncbi:MAG: helix-turn-helix domain-containing protein [Treponema sp.]|jgi:AraC-like DNA-binding protein/ligand-binding sensor protein|nr:helix-turn-helix domain-containing protein [Treponema sp.]